MNLDYAALVGCRNNSHIRMFRIMFSGDVAELTVKIRGGIIQEYGREQ